MRGSLIRTALRLGHEVIGQIRRDTALFARFCQLSGRVAQQTGI
jgi:hypothetical protein